MSLLWKILLSTSLAITALFTLIAWIVQDQSVRIASSTIEDEVRGSFHAYESLWKAHVQQLASVSLVLSRMPDVRGAFSTGDRATIRDTAREVWDKVAQSGTLLVVTDPKGAVISVLGGDRQFEWQDFPSVNDAAKRFPSQATGFVERDGQLFQTVVTPVYVASATGSALLNVLVAGVEVNSEMAQQMKLATGGSDFVFLVHGRTAASTLAGKQPTSADFTTFRTPLMDVAGREIGELRILRSFDAARSRIATLRTRIAALWIFALLLGFAVTYALARRLLRPVQALDAAAVEIANGNYDVEVEPESGDEIGRLARTFNSMCASIRSAREELIRKERLSTIARLSTSIVHDLRNPLASIYGGAEMLVDDDLSPVQVKRLASNIYRASRRVQVLLQELSDVPRSRGHARETCRLREIVQAALESVAPVAAEQNIDVQIQVGNEIELPLDRSPMERVFQNLLGNAIEAMPAGGVLRIAAERRDGDVLVYVEDSGPGIPASIAKELFRPFVTAGKKWGTGLGLALSKETVMEHGGELWADLDVKSGARFVLRLPVQEVVATSAAER
jgi:signal transduction histidine kinase